MNTMSFRPISMASNALVYHCCACDWYDGHGEYQGGPRYATVIICQRCGHASCEHHAQDNLCEGCWYENEDKKR